MRHFAFVFGTTTVLALLASSCVGPGYYDDGYYFRDANYDPYCDYYTPPWGYPPDYCRYRVWNEPVYYGGIWFNGPIYYRTYSGANWFWLNGDWRRDEWRGPRPRVDYDRGRNQFYRGEINRGRDRMPGRDGFGDQRGPRAGGGGGNVPPPDAGRGGRGPTTGGGRGPAMGGGNAPPSDAGRGGRGPISGGGQGATGGGRSPAMGGGNAPPSDAGRGGRGPTTGGGNAPPPSAGRGGRNPNTDGGQGTPDSGRGGRGTPPNDGP